MMVLLPLSPIGTDEFILAYATTKADAARLTPLPRSVPMSLRLPWNSLRMLLTAALTDQSRTTPTGPIVRALEGFNLHVIDTTLGITCPPAVLASVTTSKVEIAKELLRLPKKHTGFNLLPSVVKGPAAYLSSIIASSGDQVQLRLHALSDSMLDAYHRFAAPNGVDLSKPSPVSAILPVVNTSC